MPDCLSSSSKPRPSYSVDLNDPAHREAAEIQVLDDGSRFPSCALGYHGRMRWGTAGAFSSLYTNIEVAMRRVRYPILLLHDPDDKVFLLMSVPVNGIGWFNVKQLTVFTCSLNMTHIFALSADMFLFWEPAPS